MLSRMKAKYFIETYGRAYPLRSFTKTSKRFSKEHLAVSDESALVDLFGRRHTYLRISLTEKCNFRCTYCMPAEGVQLTPRTELPTLEERRRLIDIFIHLGVKKLRFTGGEPTVSNQLLPLLQHCSPSVIESMGITTNGFSLKRQLPKLVQAGLKSVNISLDSLQEEKFARLTRRSGSAMLRVLSSLYAAVDAGLKTKLNCVLMAGTNDDELGDFVMLTRDTPIDVRFIEFMPFDGNKWSSSGLMSYGDAIARLEHEHGIILEKEHLSSTGGNLHKDPNDTTKWFRAPGHLGRVGFITTMTDHFCNSCNRLRLTADGMLKVCLFGQDQLNLVACLRSGMSNGEVIKHVAEAIRRKDARLGGQANAIDLVNAENRSMIKIGG
eukprot:GSChrysophyteH1.ASY1.ANO1.2121.1 assembled CDS